MMRHAWEVNYHHGVTLHLTGAEAQAVLDELQEVNSVPKQRKRKWLRRVQVILEAELKPVQQIAK